MYMTDYFIVVVLIIITSSSSSIVGGGVVVAAGSTNRKFCWRWKQITSCQQLVDWGGTFIRIQELFGEHGQSQECPILSFTPSFSSHFGRSVLMVARAPTTKMMTFSLFIDHNDFPF